MAADKTTAVEQGLAPSSSSISDNKHKCKLLGQGSFTMTRCLPLEIWVWVDSLEPVSNINDHQGGMSDPPGPGPPCLLHLFSITRSQYILALAFLRWVVFLPPPPRFSFYIDSWQPWSLWVLWELDCDWNNQWLNLDYFVWDKKQSWASEASGVLGVRVSLCRLIRKLNFSDRWAFYFKFLI